MNSTLSGLIKTQPMAVIENALEALSQRQQVETINNPAGFLVKAIKQQWKPTHSAQNNRQPFEFNRSVFTDEFLAWYERAIAAGVVQDVPLNWLPLYQNYEPMVRVNQPSPLGAPYTAMRWREAVVQFGDLMS